MIFGQDYADSCIAEFVQQSREVATDDISVPTGYICRAVGSFSGRDRHYNGHIASTVGRIAAIFTAVCSFISRSMVILPAPGT